MIQEIGKYYLYRHIRLDTKVPFYIGIGTKIKGGTFKRIYKRAFETVYRNILLGWFFIFSNVSCGTLCTFSPIYLLKILTFILIIFNITYFFFLLF